MGRLNLPDTPGPDATNRGATGPTPQPDPAPQLVTRQTDPQQTNPAPPDDPPSTAELAAIYGSPVPNTALILARYLRRGRVPLRDPEHPQDVVTVNLPVAAHEFGSSLDATCQYLHRLHATGDLTVAADGTVEFAPTVPLG